MLDYFLDAIRKVLKSRLFPITIVYLVLFLVIVNRLFVLQIVEGPQIAEKNEFKKNEIREIKSTRGNIYDRYGVLLASNTLSYSVTMEDSTKITSNQQRNEIILKLIGIIEKNGDTLFNDFPMVLNERGVLEFTVSGNNLTRFKKNVYAFVLDKGNLTEAQINATPEDVYQFLKEGTGDNYTKMFGISEDYSMEDALKIMSVRYALFINYPKYFKITVASDVSENTIADVLENSGDMPGVDIQQQTRRIYHDSLYFSHMLGYTGLINAEELEQMNEGGEYYNSTDIVGKSGIEKRFEAELGGKKGLETVSVNSSGKVIDVVEAENPTAGNDIYLSIDSKLQKSIYHILEKNLAGILLTKITPNMDYGSRGESASDILIPIYEVYYAMINNNVIDTDHFLAPDATTLEQEVYRKYETHLQDVFTKLDDHLLRNAPVSSSGVKDIEEFLDYFYEWMVENGVLLKNSIPTEDSVYKSYLNGKTPLNEFIHYSITNNYIDLVKLGIGEEYYSVDEIYDRLMVYMKESLRSDGTFNKKIYRNLVFTYKLSGKEICLLLFDQGVLKYSEDDVERLTSGRISSYNFMIEKITSLDITPAMLSLEPCSGSVVITDVRTGEVLAMVTYPSYDNNMFANKVDSAYYNKLLKDQSLPLINRPTQERTAPGSTFKMVTAIAGLEESVVTPFQTIRDQGIFEKIDPPAKCHIHPRSHGSVDLAGALKVSCNYYFYELGYRLSTDSRGEYNEQLGLEKLNKYVSLLGLDAKSGVEIPEALPYISDKDAVRSSIGQGRYAFTPIQLSRYVTTIANRGISYNLTMLKQIADKDGNVLFNNQATVYHDLTDLNSTYWDRIQQGMYDVVNTSQGSVYNSGVYRNFGVTVAGKTGTSQISKVNFNNALFVSYAPFEQPEISVTTVIPNGHTSGNAAELTADIYRLYFELEDPEFLTEKTAALPENNSAAFSD